ncbi:MAG TPA: hypothetical protein VF737_00300 [Gemmatimonadaceae bacterium]
MSDSGVREGEAFVVLRDLPIQGLVHWAAPFTSGFGCTIPKGTVLVAFSDSPPGSATFACIATEPAFEALVVPEKDRTAEGYAGYSFVMPCRLLGTSIRKLP